MGRHWKWSAIHFGGAFGIGGWRTTSLVIRPFPGPMVNEQSPRIGDSSLLLALAFGDDALDLVQATVGTGSSVLDDITADFASSTALAGLGSPPLDALVRAHADGLQASIGRGPLGSQDHVVGDGRARIVREGGVDGHRGHVSCQGRRPRNVKGCDGGTSRHQGTEREKNQQTLWE